MKFKVSKLIEYKNGDNIILSELYRVLKYSWYMTLKSNISIEESFNLLPHQLNKDENSIIITPMITIHNNTLDTQFKEGYIEFYFKENTFGLFIRELFVESPIPYSLFHWIFILDDVVIARKMMDNRMSDYHYCDYCISVDDFHNNKKSIGTIIEVRI